MMEKERTCAVTTAVFDKDKIAKTKNLFHLTIQMQRSWIAKTGLFKTACTKMIRSVVVS